MTNHAIILILSLNIIFITGSCTNDSANYHDDPIVGIWVFEDYHLNLNIYTYKSEEGFRNDAPGYHFMEDGSLLVRMNAGFCGTPPISYSNFSGTWHFENDSTVQIKSEFWASDGANGPFWTETLEIVLLNDTELVVVKK